LLDFDLDTLSAPFFVSSQLAWAPTRTKDGDADVVVVEEGEEHEWS
jgi:hypothetical protein